MKRKVEGKTILVVSVLGCGLLIGGKNGVSALDADYSGAMLSVMAEGEKPVEMPVNGMVDVNQVAVSKTSYTTDVLIVRAQPGTSYEQVGLVAKYAQIEVTGVCSNGWSAVQLPSGICGYVSNEFLSDVVPEGAENIGESLGVFTVTYYCACPICCGSWSGGPTASGAYPTADWTIAADPDVLPLGTRVYMNGHEYCVEDTGSGVDGKHIDVFVTDHDLAVQNGIGSVELFASEA